MKRNSVRMLLVARLPNLRRQRCRFPSANQYHQQTGCFRFRQSPGHQQRHQEQLDALPGIGAAYSQKSSITGLTPKRPTW